MRNKDLERRLYQMRQKVGYAPSTASSRAELSTEMVSRYERGDSVPSFSNVEKLAKVYGYRVVFAPINPFEEPI